MTQPTRTAIVTGGARGIGAAIAKRLAAEGCSVAVLDLAVDQCSAVVDTISLAGGRAVAVGADVTNETAVREAVLKVTDKLGAPTVLVNNAGVIRDNLLFRMDTADWDAVMAVHLRGAFLMSKECQRYMTSAHYGRIVNLSSTSALGNRGQANYSAAKAGVQGFTRTLAIELGKFGVTVNSVAPGFIETEMTAVTSRRLGIPYDEFKAAAAARAPLGRTGTPDDVAHAVSFFVSEGAGFITGQVLYVSGGAKG